MEVVSFGGGERLDGGLAEGDEPVPSVGVGEGDAVGHFFFVVGSVELLGGWLVSFGCGCGCGCGYGMLGRVDWLVGCTYIITL